MIELLFKMSSDRALPTDGGLEGYQVPESGPPSANIADLSKWYKDAYRSCLQKIEDCSDDKIRVSW